MGGTNFLPRPIHLPSGVVARIELFPMPLPDGQGRYQPRQDCEIQVSLYRGNTLIDRRRWDTLICGAPSVTLADASTLNEDDLDELDADGWDQMCSVGLIPSAFVPFEAPHAH